MDAAGLGLLPVDTYALVMLQVLYASWKGVILTKFQFA